MHENTLGGGGGGGGGGEGGGGEGKAEKANAALMFGETWEDGYSPVAKQLVKESLLSEQVCGGKWEPLGSIC